MSKAPSQTGSAQPTNSQSQASYRLPETTTLTHAAKLSIVEDKPIMMDYWTNSLSFS